MCVAARQKPGYMSQIKYSDDCYDRKVSPKGSSIKFVRKTFRKTNISNPLIRTRTFAYQGVRNVSFLEDFTYVLND